jgi:hypothetical protein
MKKNILNLLGFSLFLASHQVFAQQCPQPLTKLDVQLNMAPLKYEYEYTSRQIQNVKGNVNPNLLGLFSGAKSINVQPSYKIVPISQNQYCMVVSSAVVRININPIIYIARESQQFPCTKQRVEQHELLHFQFEVNSASRAKAYIESIANNYYGQIFYVFNQQEINQVSEVLRTRSSKFINEISDYFERSTNPLHAQIDSQENYKYESSFCSVQENVMIHKLLDLKY